MKVFHFNPSCEMEVANQLPHFQPPKQVQHLLQDGQHLPVYFSTNQDRVLVANLPSQNYLKALSEFGFSAEVFALTSKKLKTPDKFLEAAPWGWSPSEAEKYKVWFPDLIQQFTWKPEFEHWFRRETSAGILQTLISNYPEMFTERLLPTVCKNIAEVEKSLETWGQVVMKAPLSSSGRGVQFLRKQPLNESNKQWIQGVLEQQDSVMTERLHAKILDFSFHFHKTLPGEVEFVGETAFVTNPNGKYRGSHVGTLIDIAGLPENFDSGLLEIAKQNLQKAIKESSEFSSYIGFLGVDMMLYSESEQLKIHPCVEINARRSMGLLAVFLQKWIKPHAKAQFLVEEKSEVDDQNFHLEKEGDVITTCYWPLNDFWNSHKFAFILRVE